MAHEIGHHLSGHTIQPGGSQPPTELEADKFSCFVLFRMGAALGDAQKAMNTLVPEQDGPTHPGRGKRVRAIAEGWEQACAQQRADCSDGTAVAQSMQSESDRTVTADTGNSAAPPPATADQAPTPVATPVTTGAVGPADVERVATPAGSGAASGSGPLSSGRFPGMGAETASQPEVASAPRGPVDVLPTPDPQAVPAKFGKFVIDELGVLDPPTREAFERRMFALAAEHQVEIVTLVVRSLHGLEADAYAAAMLRQLRVGKLDVGNGAVLVVAPGENQVGLAFGPGVMLEMSDYVDLEKERLRGFLDIGLPYCKGACNAEQTELLLAAADHVAQDVGQWDFQIRFSSLAELLAKFVETEQARMNGATIEPEQDPTWRKIVRIEAELVRRDAAAGEAAKWINDVHAAAVGAPLQARSSDGRHLLLYLDPRSEALMTAPLSEGRRYVFIAREQSLSQNPEDALGFDLLSYDLMP